MELRNLGKTGLRVSTLGFGCGNVGGLIIRGTPAERERAVARAMDLGVNYFDTAPSYGDGESERNLGQVLKALKARVQVGTKFRLDPHDLHDIPGAVARSLDQSLKRLAMERVDLFQLHNRIELARGAGALSLGDLLNEVLAAGALSGVEARHPVAVPSVDPIATAPDYRTDVTRAQRLEALVREGYAGNLIEASIRLAVSSDAVSTVLVGYSSLEHLEAAAAAVNRGPLPPAALQRLAALWSGL